MNTPASPEAKAIARLIRAQMAIRGVSQTKIANELGISQPTMSRKLKGGLPLNIDEIFTACHMLGIDPQETIVRGIQMAGRATTDELSIIDAVNE